LGRFYVVRPLHITNFGGGILLPSCSKHLSMCANDVGYGIPLDGVISLPMFKLIVGINTRV